MQQKIEIAVDTRESRSGIPGILTRLGISVELEALPVGDYTIGASVVERKRVDDLHSSVVSGKFWAQVGAIRESTLYPFLLVEGDDLDAGPVWHRPRFALLSQVSAPRHPIPP
jgi:ERCC4-type nuclease